MSENVIKAKDVRFRGKSVTHLPDSIHDRPKKAGVHARDSEQEIQRQRILTMKNEAYERGFSEGVLFQTNETIRIMDALSDMVEGLSEYKKNFYDGAEKQILRLVLLVAEKIIHTEISINKEIVMSVIREAITNIVDRDNIKIRLSPRDYKTMSELTPDYFQRISGHRSVSFEMDTTITPGGVVIETLTGEVDARLETQLSQIKKTLNLE